MQRHRFASGFTLTEVLIALSMIAVIAGLTTPTMVDNTGEQKLLNQSQEVAAELSSAYASYAKNHPVTSLTKASDIAAQLNYVRPITDGSVSTLVQFVPSAAQPATAAQPTMDPLPTSGVTTTTNANNGSFVDVTTPCSTTTPCYMLHSGGIIQYASTAIFGTYGTTTPSVPNRAKNAILFIFDPDGNGPQAAVSFVMTYSGRVSTMGLARGFVDDADNVQLLDNPGSPGASVLPHGYGYFMPNSTGGVTNTDPLYIAPWIDG